MVKSWWNWLFPVRCLNDGSRATFISEEGGWCDDCAMTRQDELREEAAWRLYGNDYDTVDWDDEAIADALDWELYPWILEERDL